MYLFFNCTLTVEEDLEPGTRCCKKTYAGHPMIECSFCTSWIHLFCAIFHKRKIPDVFTSKICLGLKSTTQKSSHKHLGLKSNTNKSNQKTLALQLPIRKSNRKRTEHKNELIDCHPRFICLVQKLTKGNILGVFTCKLCLGLTSTIWKSSHKCLRLKSTSKRSSQKTLDVQLPIRKSNRKRTTEQKTERASVDSTIT